MKAGSCLHDTVFRAQLFETEFPECAEWPECVDREFQIAALFTPKSPEGDLFTFKNKLLV